MSTEVLFSREGNNATIGDAKVRIPGDISVLALCGRKQNLYHGDDFTQDPDWVINTITGKRRKYLVRGNSMDDGCCDEILVWTKVLEDLPALEARYHKMREFYERHLEQVWKPTFAKLKKIKKAHVKPIRKDTPNITESCTSDEIKSTDYWIYDADERGVSFQWCAKPKKMLNPKIGKEFYDMSRRSDVISYRVHKFRSVFTKVLQDLFYKINKDVDPYARPQFMLFEINGREYALNATQYGRHGSVPRLLNRKEYQRVII
jgi:hypothetical protein